MCLSGAILPSRNPRRLGLALGLLATLGWGAPVDAAWPPFLPPPDSLSPDIAAAVERTWNGVTFSRTVTGRPTRAPFALYAALIDAPDVTAAAARFRGFSSDEVRALGPDWYEADDGHGSHGQYRVLVKEPRRRVILSWGEHSGALLSAIRGSALTVLSLEPRGEEVEQALTAHVRIDNPLAAALARALIVVFGRLADRRLREGFESADRVAEWAVERPAEFCEWLQQAPVAPERRRVVLSALSLCGKSATGGSLRAGRPRPRVVVEDTRACREQRSGTGGSWPSASGAIAPSIASMPARPRSAPRCPWRSDAGGAGSGWPTASSSTAASRSASST